MGFAPSAGSNGRQRLTLNPDHQTGALHTMQLTIMILDFRSGACHNAYTILGKSDSDLCGIFAGALPAAR
jgi:hypothetical protein